MRRLVLSLLVLLCTSCQELDMACMLIELAVPDQHYNMEKEFEGTITDFEKWWAQFAGTPLGKLFELALEHSPLLEKARSELREVAYKYGMKEDNVNRILSNLNNSIKLSVIAPSSQNTTPMNFSANHVITKELPQDFEQAGRHYFRLFKLDLIIDIFGFNQSWRQTAINDISAVIETIRDAFSLIRLDIAKHFTHIRSYQLRTHNYRLPNSLYEKYLHQIEERVKVGIHNPKELDAANELFKDVEQHLFTLSQDLKQSLNYLCLETGISSAEDLLEIIGEEFELPHANLNVFVGTPMDVILKRPEIITQMNLLKHICGIIGITYSERFPKFRIQTLFETTAKSLFDLVKTENFSVAYGYKIDQNIFEQSKVTAKLMMHRSAYHKAANAYKRVVSNALVEVADKMLKKGTIQRELENIQAQLESYEKKAGQVKIKLETSATHLLESFQMEKGRAVLIDQKIVLETENIISTMELIRSLGG